MRFSRSTSTASGTTGKLVVGTPVGSVICSNSARRRAATRAFSCEAIAMICRASANVSCDFGSWSSCSRCARFTSRGTRTSTSKVATTASPPTTVIRHRRRDALRARVAYHSARDAPIQRDERGRSFSGDCCALVDGFITSSSMTETSAGADAKRQPPQSATERSAYWTVILPFMFMARCGVQ